MDKSCLLPSPGPPSLRGEYAVGTGIKGLWKLSSFDIKLVGGGG